MARGPVRVQGLRELDKAWRAADKELAREMRGRLKEIGEIVAVDARRRFDRISPKDAATMQPSARAAGVFVQQKKRKTTGKRPDYGARQMNEALQPALEAKEDEVVKAYEEKVLDEVARVWARE